MNEPLPWLIEGSTKIARDYLRGTGELRADADRFLLKEVDQMIMGGEHRKLMLANRAIDAYRRHQLEGSAEPRRRWSMFNDRDQRPRA
jgi:hypothetical protein